MIDCKAKIVSLIELREILKKIRKQNKKIVTINGSFDLLHAGHIYSFETAKQQGDILIVCLNSDRSYKKYKDKRGPIIDEYNRSIMLASLECVDYVVIFHETNPIKILDIIKPNIHCNGTEYGKNCVESDTIIKNGGKIFLIREKKDESLMKISTTEIINKIVKRYSNLSLQKKIIFLDRDGILNKDKKYVYRIVDFEFMPGIIDLLLYLKKLGYEFIIISNQSGVGRKYFSREDMNKFNRFLESQFKKYNINFLDSYFCIHDPNEIECDCRKPRFALFQRAKKEHNINMNSGWTIGDSITDCIAGKLAGTKTILLKNNLPIKKSKFIDYSSNNLINIKRIIKK
ncbi:MAG: HAD-IIIA family hydrolase [Patescibacteria group bacterium]|nr:HAD-IIIA family hydrolase [Patescibacteria group bacterium]